MNEPGYQMQASSSTSGFSPSISVFYLLAFLFSIYYFLTLRYLSPRKFQISIANIFLSHGTCFKTNFFQLFKELWEIVFSSGWYVFVFVKVNFADLEGFVDYFKEWTQAGLNLAGYWTNKDGNQVDGFLPTK